MNKKKYFNETFCKYLNLINFIRYLNTEIFFLNYFKHIFQLTKFPVSSLTQHLVSFTMRKKKYPLLHIIFTQLKPNPNNVTIKKKTIPFNASNPS